LARTEWHLSWGKPRPELKGCSTKEEEEDDDEEEEARRRNKLYDMYRESYVVISPLRNLIIPIKCQNVFHTTETVWFLTKTVPSSFVFSTNYALV